VRVRVLKTFIPGFHHEGRGFFIVTLKILFITEGARSGKRFFAIREVCRIGVRAFIATA
jgi:hypothetical protein